VCGYLDPTNPIKELYLDAPVPHRLPKFASVVETERKYIRHAIAIFSTDPTNAAVVIINFPINMINIPRFVVSVLAHKPSSML